ncbi:DUF4185 domain-containing protein [Nocardia sp. alder85J]|uniref:DUF4185 domain-containing protein n=1 Tax=Nocardia sp. alder85J TaxID=2862949 RepID=UPI001CD21B2E|nr:DUF4185 domain-containing protein [Nocardia sp. alder85J]MCX4097590.1 DUF4185 domain-containing protein [Nocardia sp. alder85J]
MLRRAAVVVASVVTAVGVTQGGAAADPLGWLPAPVNACGEAGLDPVARKADPKIPVPPAPPAEPVTPTVQVPVPKVVPFYTPKQPDKTRISAAPLPADPCENPCPELTGGVARTDIPIPPGTPVWPQDSLPPGSAETAPTPQAAPAPAPAPPGEVPRVRIVEDPETIPVPLSLLGPDVTGPRPGPEPPVVHPPVQPAPVSRPVPAPRVHDVFPVTQLTGPGSQNRTDSRWQVNDTDLGIMWETRPGQVAVVFGDTFGQGFVDGGPSGTDWRSNVLAFSSDHDLAHGMSFDSMVSDRNCHAAEVLGSYKVNNFEMTVIPTSGFALGDRQYLSYMSVVRWSKTPGKWWTAYGGLAYSDDGGQTWDQDAYARWDNIFGQGQFQVTAMVPHDGYVYMFGTPNGRFGSLAVARVAQDDVLNKSAYQYWVDGFWRPTWQPAAPGGQGIELSASPVLSGVAGEVSVRFDAAAGQWEMTCLDVSRNVIVLRRSATPQGLWSDPATLLNTADYPAGYGGFIHPWSTEHELYFTVSEWGHYNVYLLHAGID